MESGVLITGYNVHPPIRARGPLGRYLLRTLLRWAFAAVLLFALLSIPAFPELDRLRRCDEAQWIFFEVDGQVYTERIPAFLVHLPADCP